MRLTSLQYRAARSALLLVVAVLAASAATRPRYGGTLRVEVRESIESPDPPQSGHTLAELMHVFNITQWDPPRRAVYAADENAPAGRPFVDSVEVEMARPLRDQSIDLELGKADIVQIDSAETRRGAAGRKVWTSSPVRLLVLVFGPRVDDARVREALALAVDRSAIHAVLLQRQGEVSGGLLPQWLSGYAFLFPTTTDVARAKSLVAGVAPAARALSISVPDPSHRRIADRIALNARDVGLILTQTPNSTADVRLIEVRITSADPAKALAGVASTLGLQEPTRTDTPDALFNAERAMLDGFRVIPLFHLPDVYGVNPRVKGGPGITPLGEWRFETLWIEGARP